MKFLLPIFFLFTLACQNDSKIEPVAVKADKQASAISKIDTSISLNYLLGKFDPEKDERFVRIAQEHSDRSDRLLRREAYEAFQRMQKEANKEKIEFKIISATRNFDYQKGIWERKWKGTTKVDGQNLSEIIADEQKRALKILEYSSMPGTSRHHWGTDIDINNFNNSYFETGKGKKEYDWLKENAARFGFCQPYTKKDDQRNTGYHEERWHWSYMPLSKKFTEQAALRVKEEMINGFLGAEQATKIGVVNKYILGISKDCINK